MVCCSKLRTVPSTTRYFACVAHKVDCTTWALAPFSCAGRLFSAPTTSFSCGCSLIFASESESGRIQTKTHDATRGPRSPVPSFLSVTRVPCSPRNVNRHPCQQVSVPAIIRATKRPCHQPPKLFQIKKARQPQSSVVATKTQARGICHLQMHFPSQPTSERVIERGTHFWREVYSCRSPHTTRKLGEFTRAQSPKSSSPETATVCRCELARKCVSEREVTQVEKSAASGPQCVTTPVVWRANVPCKEFSSYCRKLATKTVSIHQQELQEH